MSGGITQRLRKWTNSASAADSTDAMIYAELRRKARMFLRSELPGHPLLSSDLVNEAWIRLADQMGDGFQNRAHFFAVAARMMRRILVDHARARRRTKRGGDGEVVTLDTGLDVAGGKGSDILALNDALDAMAKLDVRQCQVVELRFFGGLSIDETAEVLHVAKATVNRDWVTARAWLIRELSGRKETQE